MPIDFPSSPTTDQIYTYAERTWKWNGEGWALIASGADGAITENKNTIATSYTLPAGYNGVSAGPITINSGVTITIPSGASWVIV